MSCNSAQVSGETDKQTSNHDSNMSIAYIIKRGTNFCSLHCPNQHVNRVFRWHVLDKSSPTTQVYRLHVCKSTKKTIKSAIRCFFLDKSLSGLYNGTKSCREIYHISPATPLGVPCGVFFYLNLLGVPPTTLFYTCMGNSKNIKSRA